MSEEKKEQEVEDKVHVSTDDLDAIEKFFKHFHFTTSKDFNDAKDKFIASASVETQKEFRFQLTKEISKMRGQNELIDDLFKNVMETSDEISYNLQFDKDLEEIIGQDPKNPAASKP